MKINLQYLFVFGVRPPYQLSPTHNHCRLNIDGPPFIIQSWQCQNVLVLSKSYFKQWPPLRAPKNCRIQPNTSNDTNQFQLRWETSYSGYAKTLFSKQYLSLVGGQQIAIFDEILIVVIENTDMCYSLPDQTIVTRGIHNCIFEKNTQLNWVFILAKYFSILLKYVLWKYPMH